MILLLPWEERGLEKMERKMEKIEDRKERKERGRGEGKGEGRMTEYNFPERIFLVSFT